MRLELKESATEATIRLSIDEPLEDSNPYRGTLLTIAWNRGLAQTIQVDETPVHLPAGALITLMTNQSFRFARTEDVIAWRFNREFYCVVDHDREVSCVGLLFYGSHGAMVLQPSVHESTRLQALLDVFVDEFEVRDDIQAEMLRTLLKRLIIRLTRLARTTYVPANFLPGQLDLVRRFNLLVEQHFRRLHRVSEYAELLHRSPKTLANLFTRYGERSPLQLIRERITVEAKRMLLYTDRSAKQIAHDLGFDSQAAFSRFFKAETGLSPMAMRVSRPISVTPAGKSAKQSGSRAVERLAP